MSTQKEDEMVKNFNKILEVYNIEPNEIERYIEHNFEKLRPVVINLFQFAKIKKTDFISNIKSGEIGSSYDKAILDVIIEAYSYEVFYDRPFYEVIKNRADIISKFKTEQLKKIVNSLIELSDRIGITLLALIYGLHQNDKKLEPNLKVLSEIFFADVEEKDGVLVFLDMYSDEKKRKEFEKSFNEALKKHLK